MGTLLSYMKFAPLRQSAMWHFGQKLPAHNMQKGKQKKNSPFIRFL